MTIDIGGWEVRLDSAAIARHTLSGAWRNQTIADAAREVAARDPRTITHIFDNRRCEVGELLVEAEALAAALQARGLVAGDVVAFQLPNWWEAVVIDLATAMLGLVVAPIIPIYREAEVGFMLADCRAKAIFVPGEYRGFDYAGMMHRLAPRLPALKLISTVRAGTGDATSYEALVGRGVRLPQSPRVDPNSVKIILYTSGTTGAPKGVLHTHNTLSHTAVRSAEHWGLSQGDTVLMASPLTHITGFGSGIELPLLCGLRTVFMERWDAAEGVKLIDQEDANFSVGATPFLQELLTEAAKQGRRLPSLRLYACGGAAVPPALIRKADEVLERCLAFRVFGSSETPLVTLGFVESSQRALAAETDGEVVHYDVRITDDDGRELPLGQAGEIRARGPAMLVGYADPRQTAESFDEDGYFLTGDLGYLTEDRAIVVTGRKKDLINRGGEKISAKEVEDLLHRHPAVQEAAVVAMPHPRLGETVCAYVIPKPGQTLDFTDMVAHLASASIARQKHPEKLVVVESLPRTASGKIRKDMLRSDVRERLASQAAT